jgi:hypothetical protein
VPAKPIKTIDGGLGESRRTIYHALKDEIQ